MELEVLQYPDPRLKKIAAPIREITPAIRQLAADMAASMYAHNGIGLAAPQIGESVRMIVTDISGSSGRNSLKVYINPVLEKLDEETVVSEEGCLSVPDYRSNVKRSARVRILAQDLEGSPVEHAAEDLEAVCLQHECDHLDGKLFIDRISHLKRVLYNSKLKKKLMADSSPL